LTHGIEDEPELAVVCFLHLLEFGGEVLVGGGWKIMVGRRGPRSRGYRLRRTSGLGGAAAPYREMRSPYLLEIEGEMWKISAAVHRWISAFPMEVKLTNPRRRGRRK
jgi:hypothetical protein